MPEASGGAHHTSIIERNNNGGLPVLGAARIHRNSASRAAPLFGSREIAEMAYCGQAEL
jgi:hypothetical protein